MRNEISATVPNTVNNKSKGPLRHDNDAQLPKVRTAAFEFESIAYLENKLQLPLPQEMNNCGPKHLQKANLTPES